MPLSDDQKNAADRVIKDILEGLGHMPPLPRDFALFNALPVPAPSQAGEAFAEFLYHPMSYYSLLSPFNVGLTVRGLTSGATARILADDGEMSLKVDSVVGTFMDGETIVDDGQVPGSATLNGIGSLAEFFFTYFDNTAVFQPGQRIIGEMSGAQATVYADYPSGGIGSDGAGFLQILASTITGVFQVGERIFDPTGTAARTGMAKLYGNGSTTVIRTTSVREKDKILVVHAGMTIEQLGHLFAPQNQITDGQSFEVGSSSAADYDHFYWYIV